MFSYLGQGEGVEQTARGERCACPMARSVAAVTKTHSRPYTSAHNPYSEAYFKTLKYRPGFPQHFDSIEHARAVCREFFGWYNHQHRRSGIGLMTPATVHYGRAEQTHTQLRLITRRAYGFTHKP